MNLMRIILPLLLAVPLLCGPAAHANPGDGRERIAALYGEFRLVQDSEGKLWTKADWDKPGRKAVAETYFHRFARLGNPISVDVRYAKDRVSLQRFRLDTPIGPAAFRDYFPEVYALLADPKAVAVVADNLDLSRVFELPTSTFAFGVVVQKPVSPKDGGYCTVIAFNARHQGWPPAAADQLGPAMTVEEFVMGRMPAAEVRDKLKIEESWRPVKNWFLVP